MSPLTCRVFGLLGKGAGKARNIEAGPDSQAQLQCQSKSIKSPSQKPLARLTLARPWDILHWHSVNISYQAHITCLSMPDLAKWQRLQHVFVQVKSLDRCFHPGISASAERMGTSVPATASECRHSNAKKIQRKGGVWRVWLRNNNQKNKFWILNKYIQIIIYIHHNMFTAYV